LRVKAQANPDLLVWARESAEFSLELAAAKLRVSPQQLAGWEAGTDLPSIPQLRKISELYKRPLAAFFMAQRPTGFMVIRDFRRHSDSIGNIQAPALSLEIRKAQERRELAIEMGGDIGTHSTAFTLRATTKDDAEKVGGRIRAFVNISMEEQGRWHEERRAFNEWRSRLETAGVLVFGFGGVDTNVARGFSISHRQLPVIGFNRKDALAGRVFTLLHEVAHLSLQESGVCDFHDHSGQAQDMRVETFCNAVAAAAIVPAAELDDHHLIFSQPRGRTVWSDETIGQLARHFSCSREVIVRRLLTIGRTTKSFYEQKRKEYKDEAVASLNRKKEKQRDMKRNIPTETVAALGKPLIGLALSSYYQQRITLNELADVLGVKARHILGIERRLNAA